MRLILGMVAAITLAGCVIVDEDSSDGSAMADRAVDVCGPANVAEVSEDGFRCKSE